MFVFQIQNNTCFTTLKINKLYSDRFENIIFNLLMHDVLDDVLVYNDIEMLMIMRTL